MRRLQMSLMVAISATLGACGPSSTPSPPKPTIKVQGEQQKQLATASEMNRAIALKRAIYDAGSTCKRVTGTGFVGDYKNMAMWQANCDDGRDWAVFIAGNGAVQVRPCTDLADLKLPLCTSPDKKTAGESPAA